MTSPFEHELRAMNAVAVVPWFACRRFGSCRSASQFVRELIATNDVVAVTWFTCRRRNPCPCHVSIGFSCSSTNLRGNLTCRLTSRHPLEKAFHSEATLRKRYLGQHPTISAIVSRRWLSLRRLDNQLIDYLESEQGGPSLFVASFVDNNFFRQYRRFPLVQRQ